MKKITLIIVAAACVAFVLLSAWMQVKEDQKRQAQAEVLPMRRRARRAAYHAAA